MARLPSLLLSSLTLSSPFAEAYRTLRANLSLNALPAGMRAVLVTSGGPGEGKTLTVANLAILTAQAGQRVIVVDADFRRPSLSQVFGLNGLRPRPGLSDLIAQTATFSDVARPAKAAEKLFIVPNGAIPMNPAELLVSRRMQAVISDLCDRADLVLLDSPPCSLYADALELTQVADGLLYILRAGPQGTVDHPRMLKQLQQRKARLIGIVMNGIEDGAAKYDARPQTGAPS